MNTQINHISLYLRARIVPFIVLTLISAGCAGTATSAIEIATTATVGAASAGAEFATSVASSTPAPAFTETPLPPEGWVDFVNDYYGYVISVPSSAEVSKTEVISIPESAGAVTFEQLNSTYPPGLCAAINYQSVYLTIRVANWLGGEFAEPCGRTGLGVVHPVWTQEEVIVGEISYLAAYGRMYESDAPDAKFLEEHYDIDMGDGARISFGSAAGGWPDQAAYDQYLNDKEIVLEILRTYRSVPRTELYCPQPVPARLQVGGFASVSTDPPLAPNNVRSAPGINQDLLGTIDPGTGMEILEGPVCNNNLQWWRVQVFGSGLTGWTPEGNADSEWLIACESRENCGTP